jgi:iron complex outermembrane receptor protein
MSLSANNFTPIWKKKMNTHQLAHPQFKSTFKPIAVAVSIICSMSPMVNAQAQTSASIPTVTVTGAAEKNYLAYTASSATRTATPLRETPVTVEVVDSGLIKDKSITTPRELAESVAGVQQVVGYGNTPSQWFVIRGFSTDGVNYRDGYRSADKYTPRDFSNVERVEFVKGPASVLYGQAQPGGAVNTITKTPLAYDYGYADLKLGSFSSARTTVDVNKALGAVSVRLNAAADSANSFVDFEKSRNTFLAPSVKIKASNDLELLYSGEFHKTTVKGFSNGLPMAQGVFDLPASATASQPWANLNNKNTTHRIEAKLALKDGWAFRQGIYDSTTTRSYQGISPAFNGADGSSLSNYPIMYNAGPVDDQRNKVWQSELTGTLKHGDMTHKLLFGFENMKSNFKYAFYDQFGCDDLNNCWGGYSKNFGTVLPAPVGGFTGGSTDTSGAKTRAFYANDQISWNAWRLMAGIRHDNITTSAGTSEESSSANTGRLGLMYVVTPQTSAYFSVSESFIPNTGARLGGGVLAPEKGRQQELGVKHSWHEGLESTLSLFEITKSNIKYDASGTGQYLTYGEQQSRGFEASLVGQINPGLKIMANYAHLDYTKITKDTPTSNASVGNSLYGVAKSNLNVWGVQQVNSNLSLGAGYVKVGKRTADNVGSGFMLPGYERIDLGVFYKLDKVDLALNLKNVNNARIFDTVDGWFVQRQAPRNVTLTAGMKF